MKPIPNYAAYSLDELKDALSRIDEQAHPEQAELIRSYIEQGGFVRPALPVVVGIEFSSAWSFRCVVAMLVGFMSVNLAVLVTGKGDSLIPVLMTASILAFILFRHRFARVAIRTWCILMLLSAYPDIVIEYVMGDSTVLQLWIPFSLCAFAIVFLVLTERTIRPIKDLA